MGRRELWILVAFFSMVVGCAPEPEELIQQIETLRGRPIPAAKRAEKLTFFKNLRAEDSFDYTGWSECVLGMKRTIAMYGKCRPSRYLPKAHPRRLTDEAYKHVRDMFDNAVRCYYGGCPDGSDPAKKGRFPTGGQLIPGSPTKFMCKNGQSVPHTLSKAAQSSGPWSALKLDQERTTLYSYEFTSGGEGKTAWFRARAIGDLDCDGVTSTFERIGTVDSESNVNGGPGFRSYRERE